MQTIIEHLQQYLEQPDVDALVLDSIPDRDVNNYGDKAFEAYHYQTNRFNKLKAGDVVIYRIPGKASPTKKFIFVGGGVVDRIERIPDTEHDVVAKIKEPFKLDPPITQQDVADFEWPHKARKSKSYEHFWNQYGMNVVGLESFKKLLDGKPWIPATAEDMEFTIRNGKVSAADENKSVDAKDLKEGFRLTEEVNQSPNKSREHKKRRIVPIKLDYEKLAKDKKTIGDLGEALVVEYLQRDSNFTDIEHVAVTKGDGLGYDITAKFKGTPVYIEVKSTSTKMEDGFFMSDREVRVAQELKDYYYIYRLFNLDLEAHTFKLNILQDPLNDPKLEGKPTVYRFDFAK